MKVHHLNCGTMRMPTVPTLVSHVLLLETDAGLVLVDTGFGLEDIAGLARRLGGSGTSSARVQRGGDPGTAGRTARVHPGRRAAHHHHHAFRHGSHRRPG